MVKNLLKSLTAIGCAALLFFACKDYDPAELLNCEKAAFNLNANGSVSPLKLLSANMLRDQDIKLLSLEAYMQDSVRVIFNLSDASYSGAGLRNDSLRLGDYVFSARRRENTAGKVVLGVKKGQAYTFLTTDTSSITISEIDVANRNISGTYYIQTVNPAMTLSGGFSKVCFLSIQ